MTQWSLLTYFFNISSSKHFTFFKHSSRHETSGRSKRISIQRSVSAQPLPICRGPWQEKSMHLRRKKSGPQSSPQHGAIMGNLIVKKTSPYSQGGRLSLSINKSAVHFHSGKLDAIRLQSITIKKNWLAPSGDGYGRVGSMLGTKNRQFPGQT